jgi:hypothetical protein
MKFPEKEPFERLLLENPICAPSVVVRKSALMDVGFCDERVSYGAWDRPLWVKIAYKYKTKIMNEILVWKYYHESTLSCKKNYGVTQFFGWEHLLSYFSDLRGVHKKMLRRNCSNALYSAGMYYFWMDDFDRFKFNLRKAVRYDAIGMSKKRHLLLVILPNAVLSSLKNLKRAVSG